MRAAQRFLHPGVGLALQRLLHRGQEVGISALLKSARRRQPIGRGRGEETQRGDRPRERSPQPVVDSDLLHLLSRHRRRRAAERVAQRAAIVDQDCPRFAEIEISFLQRAQDRQRRCITRGDQRGDGLFARVAAGQLVQSRGVQRRSYGKRGDHSWIWMPSCTLVWLEPVGGALFCTTMATRALCPSRM